MNARRRKYVGVGRMRQQHGTHLEVGLGVGQRRRAAQRDIDAIAAARHDRVNVVVVIAHVRLDRQLKRLILISLRNKQSNSENKRTASRE